MKFFILTKRSIISMAVCLFIAVLAGVISIGAVANSTETTAQPREIPIYCVDTQEKKVALSFDAAWGNEQTEHLLNILDEYNVKTTFFLVGDWVEKFPDSVKEIANRGHDVENHSNTHPYMTQLSESKMNEEIKECNKKIEELTGKCPTLFRAPYGDYNNAVVKAVKANNMYCMQWDVDSLDWKDPSPQQIVKNITDKIKCGSIILMHNGAANTPEALPMVIEAIQAEGYEIVPVSQIVPQGNYTTDANGMMHISSEGADESSTQPDNNN
ncbi:MAG: polysaccharide deacetylase family protein [Ruminococcus sp.]